MKLLNNSTFTKWEQWVYVIVVVLIMFFFWYNSPSEVKVTENISIVEYSYSCSNPFFNESDGFWYCDIDDFNYTEIMS